MILGDMIRRNVVMYPTKTAFIHGQHRATFGEFGTRVNRLIRALMRLGLKKGDRIAILAKNMRYMEVYGSSETGGLVTVPLNFRLSGPELMYIINNSGARVLLVSEEYVPTITAIKDDLPGTAHFICLDGAVPGMLSYEDLGNRGHRCAGSNLG